MYESTFEEICKHAEYLNINLSIAELAEFTAEERLTLEGINAIHDFFRYLQKRQYDSTVEFLVILAYLGQGSYNSRTKFAHYTDSVPESCGQRSYVIRTRTLSQRDKLTSYVVKYHKTASPSSAGGWCSTEGRRDGPFKSKRYAFLTNRSRIASAMV